MRHVITGGSGFTGGYLSAALHKAGADIVLFDLVEPKAGQAGSFIRGDITKPEDLARLALGPDDVVYHLAARQFHLAVPAKGRDPWFAEVNVGGTQRLVEAMSAGGARNLVFFSTDMTYGPPTVTPVPASHPQHPIGPYGRSKLAAEQLLLAAARDFGLRPTIFRPRLISGAGRLGVLSKLFALIRSNLPVPLIGSGRNRYQMIAVDDCAAAAIRAVELGMPSGPFNLGSDDPPTVKDLMREVVRKAGSKSIVLPTPAVPVQMTLSLLDRIGATLLYPEQYQIANLDYVLDTTLTKQALDWSPKRRDEDILFAAYEQFAAGQTV